MHTASSLTNYYKCCPQGQRFQNNKIIKIRKRNKINAIWTTQSQEYIYIYISDCPKTLYIFEFYCDYYYYHHFFSRWSCKPHIAVITIVVHISDCVYYYCRQIAESSLKIFKWQFLVCFNVINSFPNAIQFYKMASSIYFILALKQNIWKNLTVLSIQ